MVCWWKPSPQTGRCSACRSAKAFVVVALASEGALLFVAAQTGFIDGPRVMSNMAVDSWLPRRFASLSDRLTTKDGVVLLGLAAISLLLFTHGNVDALVTMYASTCSSRSLSRPARHVPVLAGVSGRATASGDVTS